MLSLAFYTQDRILAFGGIAYAALVVFAATARARAEGKRDREPEERGEEELPLAA